MNKQPYLKIALLAAGNSIHTIRWANSLARRGHKITLLTMHKPLSSLVSDVHVQKFPVPAPTGYFLNAPFLRRYLKRSTPHLLHAHYAGGYGTLGRLSRYHPFIISVWGSDVYQVVEQSLAKRSIIVKNIAAADCVCSTSHAMAKRTESLCPNLDHLEITPFGIDFNQFRARQTRHDKTITVGTIKTLVANYGIDILIRGFSQCKNKLAQTSPDLAARIRLRIVGDGADRTKLQRLAEDLGIADVTEFVGYVSHSTVPSELGKLDLFVAVSRNESFGVAVLEASASQLPVIVSDVGGLPEVVRDGETGLIVPSEDPSALAEAIERLVVDEQLRVSMGIKGREFVQREYEWDENVSRMEKVYQQALTEPNNEMELKNNRKLNADTAPS